MGTSANDQIHLAAFTVQSSHRTSIPDYLIISATNIKLADSIGQGKVQLLISHTASQNLILISSIQVNLELFTRGILSKIQDK